MTSVEFGALTLVSWSLKTLPTGNTYNGGSLTRRDEYGKPVSDPEHWYGPIVQTGTGPATWTHDGTPFGIYDVVGNVWELSKGACIFKDGNIMFSAVDGVPCNDPFNHELYYRKKEGSEIPGTLTIHDGRWMSFGQHLYEVSVKNDKGIEEKRFAISDANLFSPGSNVKYISHRWSANSNHYSQIAHDYSAWLRQLALLPPINIMSEISAYIIVNVDCDDYREIARGCRIGDGGDLHSMYAYLPVNHPYVESSRWSARVAWVSPDKL